MKKLLALTLVTFAMVGTSSIVNAAPILINFDSLGNNVNIDGMNLGGVTMTAAGTARTFTNGALGGGHISPPNAASSSNGAQGALFVTLTFDNLVSSVTLTGGDSGGDLDQFVIRAYDALNNLLGSFTTPQFGGNSGPAAFMNDNFTATVAFAGIQRVEVQSLINAGIVIDDLIFDEQLAAVPEPASLALWGLGSCIGLIAVRRRAKCKTLAV